MVRDLGHGVRVQKKGKELRVLSRKLSLPWRASTPGFPGTAVDFDGGFWEVHLLDSGSAGELWKLTPWPDGEVLRHTEILSSESIETLIRQKSGKTRHENVGVLLLLLSPLTGLLPARIQDRIEEEWGLPGGRATFLSALPELLGAPVAVGIYLGSWDPPILHFPAYFLFLYLFLEGLFRMGYGFGLNRPLGSLLLLPLALFFRQGLPKARPHSDVMSLSAGGIVIRMLLLGFAPSPVQKQLSRLLNLSPSFLTLMNSGMEAVGGGIDFFREGSGPFSFLSLFFLVEGCGRLFFALATHGPAGSLLGLPFRPLYRKWLREAVQQSDEEGESLP